MIVQGYAGEYDINRGTLNKINIKHLTHLTFSSVRPTSKSDAALVVPNGTPGYVGQAAGFAHSAGKLAGVAFDDQADQHIIKGYCNQPAMLDRFIANLKTICQAYGLDYVSVDCEDTSMADAEFVTLLSHMKNVLGPLGIKIGLYGWRPMAGVVQYVDWVNVAFNRSGPSSDVRFNDASKAAIAWLNVGLPFSKLSAIFAAYVSSWNPSQQVTTYAEVVKAKLPTQFSQGGIDAIYNPWSDTVTTVPNGTLYWDGQDYIIATCDKVKAQGWAGVMIFGASFDVADSDPQSLSLRAFNNMLPANKIYSVKINSPVLVELADQS
jgi:hypothetical protein